MSIKQDIANFADHVHWKDRAVTAEQELGCATLQIETVRIAIYGLDRLAIADDAKAKLLKILDTQKTPT